MRNIGQEDFGISGLNTLEKITHVLHMQALWEKAGKAYQQFSKSPPVDPEFCSCVSNVGQNEVLEALIQMAARIRVEKLDTDEIINEVRIKRSPLPAKMYNTFNSVHDS